MPKLLFSLVVLVLVTSCAVQPAAHAPDFLFPGKVVKKHTRVMPPRVAERASEKSRPMKAVKKLSVIQFPMDVSTNLITFEWQHPSGYVNGSSVISYNLYFGLNPGVYGPPISIPNVDDTTNYTLAIVDQTMSTNPPIDLLIFPGNTIFTNAYQYYFALSAVGLSESPLSKEITWPGPPWNFIVISWDTDRSLTIQQATSLKSLVWMTTTNATGTSVTLPITGTNYFYRAVTTNPPPVQLHINGEYIAP